MKKFIVLLLLLPHQILAKSQSLFIYYYEEYRPLKDNPRIVQYNQGLTKEPGSYEREDDYSRVCYQIYLDEDRAELCGASVSFRGLSPENSSFTVPETVPYEGKDYPVTCIGGMSNSLIGELIIGSNVKEIRKGAFEYNVLRKVTLPEGLTEIAENVFSKSCLLDSINIPTTVTSIGSGAFELSALKEIILPEGLKTIGFQAFGYCKHLGSISIPSSVTYIGAYAFDGCPLDDVYCYSIDVPELGLDFQRYDAFSNMLLKHECTLHVPAAAIDKYRSAEGWKNFTRIVPIGSTDGIGNVTSRSSAPSQYFDLSGRRLTAPPAKGVYIKDGKKRVRK